MDQAALPIPDRRSSLVVGEKGGGLWHFLVLAQIGNFATLRRHVGRARAARLADDVAAHLARIAGPAQLCCLAPTLVEMELRGTAVADLHRLLADVARAFAEPVDIDGEGYFIDLTLAAAAAPIGGVEEVRLIEEAESALEQAILEKRAVVRDVTDARLIDRHFVRQELEAAMHRDEVFLQYQPKMHVRRQRVGSAEALVRWQHPARGLILPNDFIPLAEEAGLIGPLTLWTLRRVIADQQTLRADGHDLTVFVNISGQLLGDRQFIAEACALIADSDAKIGFEITETSMIRDPDSAVEQLTIAAAAGIAIAIDDYGSGLSSLAYLKKLPAAELKIDKMFVMDLTSSNRDPLIVRSTIDLAHAMEMEVTAEGVETAAAFALLSVMGCDQVQGFLLSRPLSLPAFRRFMTSEAETGPGLNKVAVPLARLWKAA